MAKKKLKKFSDFTERLLPYEAILLHDKYKGRDTEKRELLNRIVKNTHLILETHKYDDTIDKRKYSKLMSWIRNELSRIDIDEFLKWITNTYQSILTDSVSEKTHRQIIKAISIIQIDHYYFRQFYELMAEYRQFLLIRKRYTSHEKVNDYVSRLEYDYKQSKLKYEQLHLATLDIIGADGKQRNEAIQWKNWLLSNFNDTRLDGYTRYMSAIRYIFICLRYNSISELEDILERLHSFFENGKNYSKRLLSNFYDHLLILYDKKGDYHKARYYGYLSIRNSHPDDIIYHNNLLNLLLKMDLIDEGLVVIDNYDLKISELKDYYPLVGFVSNHIRFLTRKGKIKEAINKGKIYLMAYESQILDYRWHRFFAAYHGALLSADQNQEILHNTEKYQLHLREKKGLDHLNGKQILNLYYAIASVNMNKITKEEFNHQLLIIQDTEDIKKYDVALLKVIEDISE